MDVELVTQALTPPRVSTAQRVCFSFFIKICWECRSINVYCTFFTSPTAPFAVHHYLFLWHKFFLYSNAYKEGFEWSATPVSASCATDHAAPFAVNAALVESQWQQRARSFHLQTSINAEHEAGQAANVYVFEYRFIKCFTASNCQLRFA